MDYAYQLYRLSQKFYNDYPNNLYPEILNKFERPYNCLIIDTHTDYFMCLPFRSEVKHNNAFKFRNSQRSKIKKSGIDYTKMVIVVDNEYLDDQNVVVDNDEYKETVANIDKIVNDATFYLQTYINHISGNHILYSKEYDRNYKYSSLQYFNSILLNNS